MGDGSSQRCTASGLASSTKEGGHASKYRTSQSIHGGIKGDRLESLYLVAMSLGLRPGELFGLHWDDVDLDNETARVRQALQRLDGKFQLVETKTDRSNRTLALPNIAVKALRAQQVRQMEDRLAAGQLWSQSGLA